MTNLYKTLTNSVKYWYIPLILGVIFFLFGIYVFTIPLEIYATLAIMFSVTFMLTGLLDVFFSIQNSKTLNGWGWYLVGGLLTLAMGIYLMAHPDITMAVLPYVVGFTVMFRSFQLFGFSLDLKDLGDLQWGNLAIASVFGIFFSFFLIANPLFSSLSLVTVTAMSFLFLGLASIVLSFNLKRVKDYPNKLTDEMKAKIESLEKDFEANYNAK